MLDTVIRTKKVAKDINIELTEHNEMLGELGEDVDKLNERMVETQGGFEKMLKSTNPCCLYITIMVELFIFIFLIGL